MPAGVGNTLFAHQLRWLENQAAREDARRQQQEAQQQALRESAMGAQQKQFENLMKLDDAAYKRALEMTKLEGQLAGAQGQEPIATGQGGEMQRVSELGFMGGDLARQEQEAARQQAMMKLAQEQAKWEAEQGLKERQQGFKEAGKLGDYYALAASQLPPGATEKDIAEKAWNMMLTGKKAGAARTQIQVDTGRQPIKGKTLSDVHERLLSGQKQLAELENITKDLSDEFLGLSGKAYGKYLGVKDFFKVTSKSDKAAINRRSKFYSTVQSMLSNYMKDMSGAAISEQEAERLKQALMSLEDNPVEFQAKLQHYMDRIKMGMELDAQAAREGIDVTNPTQLRERRQSTPAPGQDAGFDEWLKSRGM